MNALRVARAAARVRSNAAGVPFQRRGYADAVSDKIKLTLALPHQVSIAQTRRAFRSSTYRCSPCVSLSPER